MKKNIDCGAFTGLTATEALSPARGVIVQIVIDTPGGSKKTLDPFFVSPETWKVFCSGVEMAMVKARIPGAPPPSRRS